MRAIVLIGTGFAVAASLFWAAFLVFLLRSLWTLAFDGIWPRLALNSYLDRPFDEPYGSAWIGWYPLCAAMLAMLAAIACSTVIRRR